MKHRFASFAVLAAATLTVTACRGKKPAETPAPVPDRPTTPTVTPTVNRPAPPPAVDPSIAERERAAALAAAKAAAVKNVTTTIYFDYDRAELRDDARATLDAKAPVLRQNPELRIRISGHTDERGSGEYNMALGQQRAAAARRYLVGLGIAESRIDIVSFGEERPAIGGEGEGSWGKNRRDEFEIVAGADQIRGA